MKKKGLKKSVRRVLCFLQHVFLVITVVALLIVITGSNLVIQTERGKETYNLYDLDRDKTFEDSVLFNTMFGRSAANILRYGTVRSQLETDGLYDPKKVIDITAFNNREKALPQEYVTAEYYLEDLLKWYRSGFEWKTVALSPNDKNLFLNGTTKYITVDSSFYKKTEGKYYNTDVKNHSKTVDVSPNSLEQDYEAENKDGKYDVLINRFLTVDGKRIEELVSTWDEYYELTRNLDIACSSLNVNYKEYLDNSEYYSFENSNIRYCIMDSVDNVTTRIGNYKVKNNSESDTVKYFKELGTYIYYDAKSMTYETNSAITESTFRKLLKQYNYAYTNSKIWIGVDKNYTVSDEFRQASLRYNDYYPYFYEMIIAAVVAFALYMLLLIYLTIKEGRPVAEEEDGIQLTDFDRIRTEWFYVLIGVLVVAFCSILAATIAYVIGEMTGVENYNLLYEDGFKVYVGAVAFVFDIFFLSLYYSFVRRCKAKILWKNSSLNKILGGGRDFVLNTYDNGTVVLRVWVPAVVILLVNLFGFTYDGTFLTYLFIVFIDLVAIVLLYRGAVERQDIVRGINKITEGDFSYQLDTRRMHGDNKVLGESVNNIGTGIKKAVETSMKDERMKADLITNVSHDIKTPLTSIINYVDLIKREDIDNEKIEAYVKVLDEKSQRLKQLTDDLVEASKISSGNIVLHLEKINPVELINQTSAEFDEKFEEKGLSLVVTNRTDNPYIYADSRRIWRVMENLFNNIYKYAMNNTRVYVDLFNHGMGEEEKVFITIKNISAQSLNCNPEELTERFIRGDESRTTEGSGLGLSIAKNLIQLQKGTFDIKLDGDLFKVEISFPIYKDDNKRSIITLETTE